MTAQEIIKKYIKFFEERGHKQIANSSLIPENDPTTLFTSSGMQPLVPYLLGEVHPQGTRLVNSQDSFRSQDIEEIGDNRHQTFFRMMGNWSLGDYFKKEQLPWFFEFLTNELEIDPNKLYVSCFKGFNNIPKDTESEEVWKELFKSKNVNLTDRISFYGVDKNWWSRSGVPDNMPVGEPGGPDSEVFYDFNDPKIHGKSEFKNQKCHINCDCGRYMEIGNSVFMQYKKLQSGFADLPQKNVDFGGGLERLLAATENEQDVFKTSLYFPAIKKIEVLSGKKYEDENKLAMRVIADHLKASVFIILAGVRPSNKEQGYVLRRLLRRSVVKYHELTQNFTPINEFKEIIKKLLVIEEAVDPQKINKNRDFEVVLSVLTDELTRFGKSLDRGLKIIEKVEKLTGKEAFDLYQSSGFPVEITIELMSKKNQNINIDEFKKEFEKHKELSRTASSGMFKGGLANSGEQTVMGHTATHLLHRALKDVLGEKVSQAGSNITNERVRFDFTYDDKLTDEELKKIEKIVNGKIRENLKVSFEIMPLAKAKEMGAIGLFNEKYQDEVKVYTMEEERPSPDGSGLHRKQEAYSVEICGGPHVDFTGKLKRFRIIKQENIGHGLKRIYAKVG
ncbi:MAG: alanine--tRNA ligase [Candidatus Levybacteria bacterium CG_4_9_14_3_um_filter_35_16]|nr:MAG: alanine--tRNA ligase [Candidatus Levybacteria bacterium CG_4_10_14_0_2_um_filter_35_8]PJA90877.1 MAG: alanine--tRNA ligase [Candidatus Levybacteria bacterium CG_4_9_14_3_um_filter_35_16]PJC54711.1 MAG: alanine--tRNA ligase [Candidatus Levybacteria bacterium CG_4_9_14_0_2_um_filter_35_21]